MNRIVRIVIVTILALVPAFARGSHTGSTRASSTRCSTCERNTSGRIKRSTAERDAFGKHNPCPSTGRTSGSCSGYVIDHVQPLKRGGADTPSNMQWQTKADAKAKDKLE
jgi:hypothetical protein